MSGRLGNDVPQSAVDAAAALLMDEAPEPAAPQAPEVQPQEQPQPVREGRRDTRGRFVPAHETTPTPEPAAPEPQATPATPPAPEPSELEQLRAQHAQQQQELERLRSTYRANVEQQRTALEEARREAARLREAQETARVNQLATWRQQIAAMDDRDPDKAVFAANLLEVERQEFEKQRQAFEAQTAEQQAAQRQQVALRVNEEMKTGVWKVMETYRDDYGVKQFGLTPQEAQEVLADFQTPDLAAIMNGFNGPQVVEYFRTVVGPRFDAALRAKVTNRAEQNRQAAVQEGAHQHIGSLPPTAPPPAYLQFTRRGGARGGIEAVANAIMAGALDEE